MHTYMRVCTCRTTQLHTYTTIYVYIHVYACIHICMHSNHVLLRYAQFMFNTFLCWQHWQVWAFAKRSHRELPVCHSRRFIVSGVLLASCCSTESGFASLQWMQLYVACNRCISVWLYTHADSAGQQQRPARVACNALKW